MCVKRDFGIFIFLKVKVVFWRWRSNSIFFVSNAKLMKWYNNTLISVLRKATTRMNKKYFRGRWFYDAHYSFSSVEKRGVRPEANHDRALYDVIERPIMIGSKARVSHKSPKLDSQNVEMKEVKLQTVRMSFAGHAWSHLTIAARTACFTFPGINENTDW